jgi:quinol monooxygenase YgiN
VALIISTLRFVTTLRSRPEVLRVITAQLEVTRVQPGCLRCDLYQAVENPDLITLIEEWETHPDLNARLRSEDYRSILAAIELSREEPEIHFDTVIRRGGLEVIAAARAQPEMRASGP